MKNTLVQKHVPENSLVWIIGCWHATEVKVEYLSVTQFSPTLHCNRSLNIVMIFHPVKYQIFIFNVGTGVKALRADIYIYSNILVNYILMSK